MRARRRRVCLPAGRRGGEGRLSCLGGAQRKRRAVGRRTAGRLTADQLAGRGAIASVVPADDDPPSDAGQRQGRRFRLDRIARRARETAPGLDRHRRLRTSPRPDDLALDEDGARPDARGPERAATIGVGDQELAIGSLEEEVRVAAREEPRGRRGRRGGAERRLVAGEDPRVADRCSHRRQRPAERVERRAALPRARSPPTRRTPRAWSDRRRAGTGARARGEPRAGRPRAAARSRRSAAARRPTGSRPCRSVRRTGAGWGVRRAPRPPRRRSSSRRRGRRAGERPGPRRPAGRLASSGSLPSEKTARSRAATTYALKRGPQSWTSDGSSQVDGSVPSTRAWIERSAARGMLSCRPAHAARRSERRPRGSRSSSAPTCRRNARICARVRLSRDVVTSPLHDERSLRGP